MRHTFISAGTVLSLASSVFAGGLMHNTNQSIDFVRNFAQDASTGTQAVYYNPAGLAFGRDGWHIAVHNQTIWQTRTITADGLGEYDGEAFVPAMPSLMVDLHRGSWNAFAAFMIIGGGGSVEFDEGVPIIDALLGSTLKTKLAANKSLSGVMDQYGISTTDLYNASFTGTQYVFGGLLGGTYQINDMFSVAIGARINYAVNSYKGEMESTLDPELENVVGKEMYAGLSKQLNQTLLDCEQTGWGITPIIGAHFHYKNFDAGVKYEHNTSIEVENDTKEIADDVATALPQFIDGKKSDNDMPGFLSVGLAFAPMDWARASVGYHLYLDKFADYPQNKEDMLDKDEKEFVFGLEVDPLQKLTLSLGVQRTLFGLTDQYVEDLGYNLNSWSFGGGFAVKITDYFKVQAGYMITLYESRTETDTFTHLKTKYERTSNNVGIGFNLDI